MLFYNGPEDRKLVLAQAIALKMPLCCISAITHPSEILKMTCVDMNRDVLLHVCEATFQAG